MYTKIDSHINRRITYKYRSLQAAPGLTALHKVSHIYSYISLSISLPLSLHTRIYLYMCISIFICIPITYTYILLRRQPPASPLYTRLACSVAPYLDGSIDR